jgi:hypothetical protein
MLNGDPDHFAAYLRRALRRPRVNRKMNRRQRIGGETAEIALKELAALLDRTE